MTTKEPQKTLPPDLFKLTSGILKYVEKCEKTYSSQKSEKGNDKK